MRWSEEAMTEVRFVRIALAALLLGAMASGAITAGVAQAQPVVTYGRGCPDRSGPDYLLVPEGTRIVGRWGIVYVCRSGAWVPEPLIITF